MSSTTDAALLVPRVRQALMGIWNQRDGSGDILSINNIDPRLIAALEADDWIRFDALCQLPVDFVDALAKICLTQLSTGADLQSLSLLSALLSERSSSVKRPAISSEQWRLLSSVSSVTNNSATVVALIDALRDCICTDGPQDVTFQLHCLNSILYRSHAAVRHVHASAELVLTRLIARISSSNIAESMYSMRALLTLVVGDELEFKLFNEANVLQALHLIFGVLEQSEESTLKIHACDLLQQVLSTSSFRRLCSHAPALASINFQGPITLLRSALDCSSESLPSFERVLEPVLRLFNILLTSPFLKQVLLAEFFSSAAFLESACSVFCSLSVPSVLFEPMLEFLMQLVPLHLTAGQQLMPDLHAALCKYSALLPDQMTSTDQLKVAAASVRLLTTIVSTAHCGVEFDYINCLNLFDDLGEPPSLRISIAQDDYFLSLLRFVTAMQSVHPSSELSILVSNMLRHDAVCALLSRSLTGAGGTALAMDAMQFLSSVPFDPSVLLCTAQMLSAHRTLLDSRVLKLNSDLQSSQSTVSSMQSAQHQLQQALQQRDDAMAAAEQRHAAELNELKSFHEAELRTIRTSHSSIQHAMQERTAAAEINAQKLQRDLVDSRASADAAQASQSRLIATVRLLRQEAAEWSTSARQNGTAATEAKVQALHASNQMAALQSDLDQSRTEAKSVSDRLEHAFQQLMALAQMHRDLQNNYDAALCDAVEHRSTADMLQSRCDQLESLLNHAEAQHRADQDVIDSERELAAAAEAEQNNQIQRLNQRLGEYELTMSELHKDLQRKDELISMIHKLAKTSGASSA